MKLKTRVKAGRRSRPSQPALEQGADLPPLEPAAHRVHHAEADPRSGRIEADPVRNVQVRGDALGTWAKAVSESNLLSGNGECTSPGAARP